MVNKLCATSHVPVNTAGIKCAEATRILFDLGVKRELHVLYLPCVNWMVGRDNGRANHEENRNGGQKLRLVQISLDHRKREPWRKRGKNKYESLVHLGKKPASRSRWQLALMVQNILQLLSSKRQAKPEKSLHMFWKSTKTGNAQNPSKTQFIHWVSEAWNEVTTECVKAGFNEACWKHISDENWPH